MSDWGIYCSLVKMSHYLFTKLKKSLLYQLVSLGPEAVLYMTVDLDTTSCLWVVGHCVARRIFHRWISYPHKPYEKCLK